MTKGVCTPEQTPEIPHDIKRSRLEKRSGNWIFPPEDDASGFSPKETI